MWQHNKRETVHTCVTTPINLCILQTAVVGELANLVQADEPQDYRVDARSQGYSSTIPFG